MNAWAAKKIEREGRIIAAATRLFDQFGYSRTTMEEIAAAAGCGVATVYNYYANKEGIAAELLRRDMEKIYAAGKLVIDDLGPSTNPGQAVMALLDIYRNLGGRDWARRDLLRIIIFPNLGNNGVLTELIRTSDAMAQSQIRALLEKMKNSGRLVPEIDLDDAASIIFDIFNQSFGRYLTHDDLKFEKMFAQLTRRIRLLFENWQPLQISASKDFTMAKE